MSRDRWRRDAQRATRSIHQSAGDKELLRVVSSDKYSFAATAMVVMVERNVWQSGRVGDGVQAGVLKAPGCGAGLGAICYFPLR